jgi:hypothetical protein
METWEDLDDDSDEEESNLAIMVETSFDSKI